MNLFKVHKNSDLNKKFLRYITKKKSEILPQMDLNCICFSKLIVFLKNNKVSLCNQAGLELVGSSHFFHFTLLSSSAKPTDTEHHA